MSIAGTIITSIGQCRVASDSRCRRTTSEPHPKTWLPTQYHKPIAGMGHVHNDVIYRGYKKQCSRKTVEGASIYC